jgi:hypothetical protein
MTMTIPAGMLAPADLARPSEPSDTADSAATSLYEAIG